MPRSAALKPEQVPADSKPTLVVLFSLICKRILKMTISHTLGGR